MKFRTENRVESSKRAGALAWRKASVGNRTWNGPNYCHEDTGLYVHANASIDTSLVIAGFAPAISARACRMSHTHNRIAGRHITLSDTWDYPLLRRVLHCVFDFLP